MSINTIHPKYGYGVALTERVRDFADGEDAVKSKGDQYLPMLSGQSKDEYDAYKSRGHVVPAVSPTAKAISGAIMRKSPIVVNIGKMESDFDGEGTDVEVFVGDMIGEILIAGAAGYLVEFDEELGHNTVKQYTRENIVNVSENFIVLRQFYEKPDDKNRYKMIECTEYLELTYDENGNYIQRLWREGTKDFEIVDVATPTSRGDALSYIPFVFAKEGRTLWSSKPILLNLANVNLDQYKLSTDLRHGLHWTALPTLFLFGDITDEDGNRKQIKVGAGSSNHIQDGDARAELLEFTGSGLSAIEKAIQADINTMAAIGAKMLTSETSGVRAAETARIEASGETATLSGIANVVDSAMEQILKIVADWSGSAQADFAINRDFIDVKLEPATLMALLKTWQSGGMSLDTFLHQLERGELLPEGVTAKQEADRIETTGRDFDLEETVEIEDDEDDEQEEEDVE